MTTRELQAEVQAGIDLKDRANDLLIYGKTQFRKHWVAMIVFFVGAGGVWQWAEIKGAKEDRLRESLVAANSIQADMRRLHAEIFAGIQDYIYLRDDHLRLEGGAKPEELERSYENPYVLQSTYNQSLNGMVRLISDYNASEARLSILENRQPVWFDISGLQMRPPPPTNLTASPGAEPGQVLLMWKVHEDELVKRVQDNLVELFKMYGQPITRTATIQVSVQESSTIPANP